MPDIFQDFSIIAKRWPIFAALTTPEGLNEWWQIIDADQDWSDTRVRFELVPGTPATPVRFRHVGWRTNNDLYRVSCSCWAAYLRILRRWFEHGERVPHERRLEL
ncbi:MAG: hypothetical protein ACHQQ3_07325 [Gemmatimonadales bacterium]